MGKFEDTRGNSLGSKIRKIVIHFDERRGKSIILLCMLLKQSKINLYLICIERSSLSHHI